MNKFAQLVTKTAEEAARHLAEVTAASQEMRKVGFDLSKAWGDASGAVSGAASHVGNKLLAGDPKYLAGAGAVGLGGLGLARELSKPKEDRRYENVALGAGIGGALGLVPSLLGNALPDSNPKPVGPPKSLAEQTGPTRNVEGKTRPAGIGHRVTDVAANYVDAAADVGGLSTPIGWMKGHAETLTGQRAVDTAGNSSRTGGLLDRVPQGTVSGGLGSIGLRMARGAYNKVMPAIRSGYQPKAPGWLGRLFMLAPLVAGAAHDVSSVANKPPQ